MSGHLGLDAYYGSLDERTKPGPEFTHECSAYSSATPRPSKVGPRRDTRFNFNGRPCGKEDDQSSHQPGVFVPFVGHNPQQMSSRDPEPLADESSPLLATTAATRPDQHGPSAQIQAMAILQGLAAIYGGTAVVLGAFGAHGLKKKIADPQRLQNWNTAAQVGLMRSFLVITQCQVRATEGIESLAFLALLPYSR